MCIGVSAASEGNPDMHTYAIIGGTLWGNRGAEAMVVTTVGRIREREPDARFLILSYQYERDVALVDDPDVAVLDAGPVTTATAHFPFAVLCWLLRRVGIRVPGALLPQTVRQLRGCRALFDVTGISFHDGRLAVVAYNLLCLWPALLLGVPVVRLSQAMGPFRHRLNRLPAREVLKHCFHSFARGRHTADYVRQLDVPSERWSVAADVAFAYDPAFTLTRENEEHVAEVSHRIRMLCEQGTEVVALVPSSLVLKKSRAEGSDYVGVLRRLVRALHGWGYHVLVMPNATSEGTDTLRNNDIVVVDELRERLGAESDGVDGDGLTFVDFDLNTRAIRSLLGPTELVITSRFHAMVAALALGIPTLVLGWSHKYEEVLEMFDCADVALDFSEADKQLIPLTEQLLRETDARRERIDAAGDDVHRSANSQFDVFDQLPPRR